MAFCVKINVLHLLGCFEQIILMSASINCEEFADYFALPVHDSLNPACVFKVDGKPYEIEEYYLDDLKYCVHFQVL